MENDMTIMEFVDSIYPEDGDVIPDAVFVERLPPETPVRLVIDGKTYTIGTVERVDDVILVSAATPLT